MRKFSATLVFALASTLPFISLAAEPVPQTAIPSAGTPVYPCWDTMQGGHMMSIRGMWPGGHMGSFMMMRDQDVKQMQQEIKDLKRQIEEMKEKKK